MHTYADTKVDGFIWQTMFEPRKQVQFTKQPLSNMHLGKVWDDSLLIYKVSEFPIYSMRVLRFSRSLRGILNDNTVRTNIRDNCSG
jgi:hypothetical protein